MVAELWRSGKSKTSWGGNKRWTIADFQAEESFQGSEIAIPPS